MAMENKYSPMEISILGIMSMANLMEKEDISGMKVGIMKEHFSKGSEKVKVNGSIRMEQCTKANSKEIVRMGLESRHLRVEKNSRDSSMREPGYQVF